MNRQETMSLLERHDIIPTRSLGQNFLTDDRVVERICAIAGLGPEDLVIEIGPGIGGLTRELARRAGRVIAVEIDRHVLPALNDVLAEAGGQSTVIHADALETNLSELTAGWQGPVKVVANLPYYITTPLIIKILTEIPECSRLVFMIQKEAAARITARPGSKQYGPLAVLAACFGETKKELTVPADAFYPRPGVDSCIIRIISLQKMQIDDWLGFRGFLECCFAQRRRLLANSLKIAGISPERLARLPEIL